MPTATLATALFAAFVLALPLAVSLSVLAGAAAVVLPQTFCFALVALYHRRPYAFWAVKFSLTILLLALSLRLLHEGNFLAAPYFLAGVVLALGFNLRQAARFAQQRSEAEGH